MSTGPARFQLAKLDPEVRARLLASLTDTQIRLLARVLVDGETQHAIAKKTKAPRSTVQSRIHAARACARKSLGVDIPLPRRGRPRKIETSQLDPAQIEDLAAITDADGITHGRWDRGHNLTAET